MPVFLSSLWAPCGQWSVIFISLGAWPIGHNRSPGGLAKGWRRERGMCTSWKVVALGLLDEWLRFHMLYSHPHWLLHMEVGAGMRPELQLVGEVEFGEATSYPDVHTTDHKEGLCSSFAEGWKQIFQNKAQSHSNISLGEMCPSRF